ncbi:MAG TPA: ECF-type sigma factor [Planctomycetota bacterium]|nr:ECF-type sigma factor [Planctomycetota bacterium]
MTALLQRMAGGERAAADELYAVLYDELRERAGRLMAGDRGHTLQPTAVVHEAWLKIAGGAQDYGSRAHFLGVAAKAMRSVLVDHARAGRADKRGGGRERVPLDDAVALFETRVPDLVELDDLLDRLAAIEPELARIVELRFFAGLSIGEAARALGISTATVERGWRTARAWLRVAIDRGPSARDA